MENMELILKVSKNTVPGKLASMIARGVQEQKDVYVRAIGAGAINQAVKALAIAKDFAVENGNNIVFVNRRIPIEFDEKTTRQAIEFKVMEVQYGSEE